MGITKETIRTHQEKVRTYLHELIRLENENASVHKEDLKIESSGLEYSFTIHHQYDMPKLIVFKIYVEDITYLLRDDKASCQVKIHLPDCLIYKKSATIKTTIGAFMDSIESVFEENDMKKRMSRILNSMSTSVTLKEYSINSFIDTFIKNFNNNGYAKFKKVHLKKSIEIEPRLGYDTNSIRFIVQKENNFYAFKTRFEHNDENYDIEVLHNIEKQENTMICLSIDSFDIRDKEFHDLYTSDLKVLPFLKFLSPTDSTVSAIIEHLDNLDNFDKIN